MISLKDIELNGIEKFIVDVNDPDSIKNMCKQAKVVINCVGPVSFGFDISQSFYF
jgi:short subunit dehydrogenase-like uncharacterized protein